MQLLPIYDRGCHMKLGWLLTWCVVVVDTDARFPSYLLSCEWFPYYPILFCGPHFRIVMLFLHGYISHLFFHFYSLIWVWSGLSFLSSLYISVRIRSGWCVSTPSPWVLHISLFPLWHCPSRDMKLKYSVWNGQSWYCAQVCAYRKFQVQRSRACSNSIR